MSNHMLWKTQSLCLIMLPVDNLGQDMVMRIVINQVVIMLIGKFINLCVSNFLCFSGVVGNVLTLTAIPYVRSKYGSEFSILKLNSVVLILHLSFCDLLYNLIGFPHLIQVNHNIYKFQG